MRETSARQQQSFDPKASPPLALPARFGRYRLTRLLAVGGMAQIYLAKAFGAEGFVKPLVIKRLDPRLADNTHFTNLFVNEAKLLVSLNHGNIVPVFDFGRVEDGLYMAMEYIAGASLRRLSSALVEAGERLEVQLAAHVAAEICKGLDYAHRKCDERNRPAGIIHRDIKPTNVLISFEGEVKIVDFGVAKLAGRVETEGMLTGTLAYMSPEQAERQAVDPRTDIFSTGLVLYELATGRRAYDASSPLAVLTQARTAQLPPLPDEVPAELRQIIRRATEPDPLERFGSAHEMEHALSEYLLLARTAPAQADSVSPASRLAELMRRLPLDQEAEGPEADLAGDDARALVELDGIRMEAESGLSELAGPPDLELIQNAAETFHSEFMTRVLSEEQAPPVRSRRTRSRRALVAAVLGVAVLGVAVLGGLGALLVLGGGGRTTRSTASDARPPDARDATRPGAARMRQGGPAAADLVRPASDLGSSPKLSPEAGVHRRVEAPAAAAARRPRHGYLNLNSVPWSTVTIDGRRLPRPTPLLRVPLRSGWHTVVLENRERGLRRSLRVRVRAGATTWKVVRLGER